MEKLSLEESIFGRKRKPEEEFGVYRRIVIGKATDDKILQVSQDGGVVTALLTIAFENGIIDGAAVSGVSPDKPLYPVPKLVTTPEEALKCAGTRYTYSPNLVAFHEGVKKNKKSLAFIGTPCQVLAIRKNAERSVDYPLQFAIGLLCTESFDYEGLVEGHIKEKLGINLNDVTKVNIKGKILVTTKSGETTSIPLKEAKQYIRTACSNCVDFSSELADISVGGLGLNGWTFTILRTEKGEELFDSAVKKGYIKTRPIEEEQRAHNLLLKLSSVKRKRTTVRN
jgi:coenzyme F420 hydrogenase subunit beta